MPRLCSTMRDHNAKVSSCAGVHKVLKSTRQARVTSALGSLSIMPKSSHFSVFHTTLLVFCAFFRVARFAFWLIRSTTTGCCCCRWMLTSHINIHLIRNLFDWPLNMTWKPRSLFPLRFLPHTCCCHWKEFVDFVVDDVAVVMWGEVCREEKLSLSFFDERHQSRTPKGKGEEKRALNKTWHTRNWNPLKNSWRCSKASPLQTTPHSKRMTKKFHPWKD